LTNNLVAVSPSFYVTAKANIELVQVVHDDRILILVAVPPEVNLLRVSRRKLLPGLTGLACTTLTPIPTGINWTIPLDIHVVLLDGSKVLVMPNENIGGNQIKPTLNGILSNLIPILLGVPLNRLHAELPRAFQPGVFLEAVNTSPIVNPNWLEVGSRTVRLQLRNPNRVLEIQKELNMNSPFGPPLNLAIHVPGSRLGVPSLNVITGKGNVRVVQSP
jgi:hypothetical protein